MLGQCIIGLTTPFPVFNFATGAHDKGDVLLYTKRIKCKLHADASSETCTAIDVAIRTMELFGRLPRLVEGLVRSILH